MARVNNGITWVLADITNPFETAKQVYTIYKNFMEYTSL